MFRATLILVLSIIFISKQGLADQALYGTRGICLESVRQGRLGSCYFHSVIAALAYTHPEELKKMIQENQDSTYTVEFVDGVKETIYPEDLQYARKSGYDISDGLWVSVLLRAYSQRVLRGALLEAVSKSELSPLLEHFGGLKQIASDLIVSNDLLLLAYDRAIRKTVSQDGTLDKLKLKSYLEQQMQANAVPETVSGFLITHLDSKGFFDTIVQTVNENGEVFGAYRAVGQGGLMSRVMKCFFGGSARQLTSQLNPAVVTVLKDAVNRGLPVTTGTCGSAFSTKFARSEGLPRDVQEWYVDCHAYTILRFDAATLTVVLRNPWGRHPQPDGVFSLPITMFIAGFRDVVVGEPLHIQPDAR